MSTSTQLLGTDHIDLLVTAASRWRILASQTSAAFGRLESHVVVATATGAGRLLREQNLAATRRLSDRGRGRLADRCTPGAYTFTEVEHLVPVEVIKACHAAEQMCAAAPSWEGSTAQRLLAAVAAGAAHRLDGYSSAPWAWARPQRRSGPPVAVGGAWRPHLDGIRWIGLETIRDHWDSAALVVITTEVAAQVPADLGQRSGVFILAEHEPADAVWQAILALDVQALVLFWPVCEPWLAEQVSDPDPEFVEHRQGERR